MKKEFFCLFTNYPKICFLSDLFIKNNNRNFWDFMKYQKLNSQKNKKYYFKILNNNGRVAHINIAITAIMDLIVISEEISEKFIELIPNIELYPAKISGINSKYFVVNFLDEIDCIDLYNSSIKWGKKQPEYDNTRFINNGSFSFVFYKDKDYPPIFRPKHVGKMILVTEKFKIFSEQNGIIDDFIFQKMIESDNLR